ncbi:MAG: hypothetical protein HYV03_03145 [Deltaproteobacteria bacterium]|nr:hypothetical protein [Deltaproteobacteria bacterium]
MALEPALPKTVNVGVTIGQGIDPKPFIPVGGRALEILRGAFGLLGLGGAAQPRPTGNPVAKTQGDGTGEHGAEKKAEEKKPGITIKAAPSAPANNQPANSPSTDTAQTNHMHV